MSETTDKGVNAYTAYIAVALVALGQRRPPLRPGISGRLLQGRKHQPFSPGKLLQRQHVRLVLEFDVDRRLEQGRVPLAVHFTTARHEQETARRSALHWMKVAPQLVGIDLTGCFRQSLSPPPWAHQNTLPRPPNL